MDFLNKSLAQFSELFRSMTPGARVTAGLLLAVVVVSVGYLFRETANGPDAFLFGGAALSNDQLTKVEAAIAQAGLSGAEREGNRIRVPVGQQSKFLAAVADGGVLPAGFNTILEDALGKGGPWESAMQTRERLKIAKQQTLGEIVRGMYWVENAVVLYDEKETRTARSITPVKQASASVSVKPVVGEMLSPTRAKNIQKLVASAVNMQPNEVVVTNLGEGGMGDIEGQVTADMFPEGSLMHTKVAFETLKRENILNALNYIPGVRVSVNADFDDTVEQQTRSLKPDREGVTPSRTSETTETTEQTTSKGGGQPGATAQGPNRQVASEASQQNLSKTRSEVIDTENVVPTEETRSLKQGYTPKEVWATVVVPSSYVESVWKLRNPTAANPPKPNDLQLVETDIKPKIENIVEPILVLKEIKANAEDTFKHVRVQFLDLLPTQPIPEPSVASTATLWLGRNWSTLAMLGVAMFSLLVLRSVVNSKPAEIGGVASSNTGLSLHAEELSATSPAEGAGESSEERPRLKLRKGNTLRDDLVEVVREDPDAAADILRSWIAKAG